MVIHPASIFCLDKTMSGFEKYELPVYCRSLRRNASRKKRQITLAPAITISTGLFF